MVGKRVQHEKPIIQGVERVVSGNRHRGRKTFLVVGFLLPGKSLMVRHQEYMKTKYKVLIIVVFVLVAIVLWAIAGSTNKSEQGNQDTSITLSDAQALIGMDCIGSEVSQECTWNETRYDFLIPGDWNSDRKKRVEACEQGYINEAYNFVTDGQTWYATANFEKENNVLMEAFQDIGFESEVASFCR